MSGSGPLGAEAQIAWLGQPAQASDCPACSDSGPGQCSGSGATRSGAVLRGADSADWTDVVRSASSVGAIVGLLYSDEKHEMVSSLIVVVVPCSGAILAHSKRIRNTLCREHGMQESQQSTNDIASKVSLSCEASFALVQIE